MSAATTNKGRVTKHIFYHLHFESISLIYCRAFRVYHFSLGAKLDCSVVREDPFRIESNFLLKRWTSQQQTSFYPIQSATQSRLSSDFVLIHSTPPRFSKVKRIAPTSKHQMFLYHYRLPQDSKQLLRQEGETTWFVPLWITTFKSSKNRGSMELWYWWYDECHYHQLPPPKRKLFE